MAETISGPLADVEVLDAGNMIAGPMAAAFLADYGAEVTKLEHPSYGDPIRDWEPRLGNVPLWWKVLNRNKKAITLNLGTEQGRDLFLELVKDADVVIENYRSGTFEKWGLSYEELAAVNPGVVLLRITGFGQTGPMAGFPGYGTVAEAMSGIPHFTGMIDGPPTLPGFPMADAVTAVFGALAAISAIHCRDNLTGRGQEIDLSLYESLFRLVDSQAVGYAHLGRIKQRQGNRLEEDAPRNIYATRDGKWIAVSASSNRTWERLAQAMGRPELAEDPRFSSAHKRIEYVDELDEIIGAWFEKLDEKSAMELLVNQDVVAGPVLNIEDIFNHPQYMARENLIRIPDDEVGQIVMQSVVPKFSDTPGKVRHAGKKAGADNRDVYVRKLGLGDDDLARLEREQVI